MQKFALVCLFLLAPALLRAQTKNDAWDGLRSLRVGEKVEVVESSMKKHTGTFSTVTEEAIQIRENSNDVGIRKENVARVTLLDKGHRLRNALIFAAVGGGAGAGIGAAAAGSHSFLGRGPATAVGAVIGLAGGAAIGAAIPSHPTIYRAQPPKSNPPH